MFIERCIATRGKHVSLHGQFKIVRRDTCVLDLSVVGARKTNELCSDSCWREEAVILYFYHYYIIYRHFALLTRFPAS